VLKHRIQIGQHSGIMEALQHSYQTEGIFGLFTGGKYFSQVCRDVPYAVVCILAYEVAQSKVKQVAEVVLSTSANIKTPEMSTAKAIGSVVGTNINNLVCGAIAGGFGALLTNPMDVIMTRTMTARKEPFIAKLNPGLYSPNGPVVKQPLVTAPVSSQTGLHTIWQVANNIVQNEGWAAFTTGAAANVMGKVPANALFFLWYENIRSFLDVDKDS
jgi:hypothetical protein